MLRMALHWQILLAMVIGATTGILLNALAGKRTTEQPIQFGGGFPQLLGMAAPVDVPPCTFWSSDSPERILIQVDELMADEPAAARYQTRRIIVGDPKLDPQRRLPWPEPLGPADDIGQLYVPTVKDLPSRDPQAFALFHMFGRSPARRVGDVAGLLGELFLRMLKMVSIPLIVTSLVTGVTSLGNAQRLGRLFSRTIGYYLVTSMLAIVTGLAVVNVIRPGVDPGVVQPDAQNGDEPAAQDAPDNPPPAAAQRRGKGLGLVLFEQLRNLIPNNPVEALSGGDFLSIIAFSLAFAVCTILVGGQAADFIRQFFEAAYQVMMKMTMLIIVLAPAGVLFLMLSATAAQGAGIFGTLGWYMVSVACALLIHATITLPLIVKFIARRSPAQFAQAMSPALLTAFSSASSNGTLPLTLTCVERRAVISNRIGSFVLPLGATVNMDGTALYEVVAVLFLAQLGGVELTLADQVVVALTALMASIGAAGIPHAGLVMMIIILQAVGLPTENQGLIIAVDRVLDMCRTSVNVWSDSCGCAVVDRLEINNSG